MSNATITFTGCPTCAGPVQAIADGDAVIYRHADLSDAERIEAGETPKQKIDFKGMWNAISDRASHPPAQAALSEFVRLPDAERVAIGRQVAARVDEMTAQPTKLEDAVREVIADMRMAKSPYCQAWADKLASALQENAK